MRNFARRNYKDPITEIYEKAPMNISNRGFVVNPF